MNIQLRDLITIFDASEKFTLNTSEILFDALEGNLSLFALSNKDLRETLVPCKKGVLHRAYAGGEFIHQYDPLFGHKKDVDIQLGQVLEVNEKSIKGLIVNQQFSEVELYKPLAPIRDDLEFDFWETEREVYSWEEGIPAYSDVTLERIYVLEAEVITTKANKENKVSISKTTTGSASSTALKVIGLLMHHLAKSPKYASGTSPNRSQIKELLLDLAEELDVNSYGLSKVDERLLSDALKHIESQKN